MVEVHPEFADQVTLYVVGASPIDSPEGLEQFMMDQGYTWPVAAPGGSMLRDLNVVIRSTKIAIDANGVITYRATFGQGGEDEWREVFEELASQS